MQQFNYPDGVKILPGHSYERAQAFVAPTALVVALVEAKATATDVQVTALLTNAGDDEVLVIGFPIGAGPFYARIIPSALIDFWRADDPARPSSLPPPMPPAPPPPLEFLVPPRSQIAFTTTVGLERYRYQGAPAVEVEWVFHYWNEPMPRARTTVTLPAR